LNTNKNNLVPATAQDASFIYNSTTRVHLIDIPGFTDIDTDTDDNDDTTAQEAALARINALISAGKTISGIIFLHPITNEHNTGLALRNVELFRELCGASAQARSFAVLATSMWSHVDPDDGARREAALVTDGDGGDDFFAHMHREGSPVFRFSETRESALEILSYLLAQKSAEAGLLPTPPSTPPPATPPQTATETVETEVADKAVQTEDDVFGGNGDDFARIILAERERHMARLADMYAHMEQATREHDGAMQGLFRAEVDALKQKITDAEAEQVRLRRMLAEVTEHKELEVCALKDELDRARRAYLADVEAQKASAEESAACREGEFAATLALREQTLRQEGEERVKALLEEMTAESEARVAKVKEEMTSDMVSQVADTQTKMEEQIKQIKTEHDQNMMALKSEITRLMGEKEALLLRAQRAEAATATTKSEHRTPMQAWAVARLWGVGQARSR